MKRNVFSLALALLLCLALSAAAFAAADISGRYNATDCRKDGVQYGYADEYLELNANGTGRVTFSGTLYDIEWTLSGSDFHFVDEDGYEMDGTYRNGVISGNYAGYDFTYEAEQTASAPSPVPVATPTPAQSPAGADLSAFAGVYKAVSCIRDGKSYACEEDAIELLADGTGTVVFNGKSYALEWSLQGESFAFADEDGDVMEGTLSADTITGRYAGYDYVFERSGEALPSGWVDDGVIPGTYYAESCESDGSLYSVGDEYIVLNEDGSAMLVYSGSAFPSSWTLTGDSFSLRDNRGSVMTGTLSGGRLESEYRTYRYVYRKGQSAPIVSLSPENWNGGLPSVTDQAGILSAQEESNLRAEADALSAKYGCGVYVVTLDDMRKFSLNGGVECCAEEIRVGYDLGSGSDKDCILLLMSMADRSYDLCIYGSRADAIFNEYARSTIESAMLDDFRGNDWYAGYRDYLAQCARILEADAAGKPITRENSPAARAGAVFGSILLAFLIAIIFCSVKKGKMKSVAEKQRAANYIPDSGVNIAFRSDQYTHSTTVRVYDPPESKSSSGGGGGHSSSGHSHSSGHF